MFKWILKIEEKWDLPFSAMTTLLVYFRVNSTTEKETLIYIQYGLDSDLTIFFFLSFCFLSFFLPFFLSCPCIHTKVSFSFLSFFLSFSVCVYILMYCFISLSVWAYMYIPRFLSFCLSFFIFRVYTPRLHKISIFVAGLTGEPLIKELCWSHVKYGHYTEPSFSGSNYHDCWHHSRVSENE